MEVKNNKSHIIYDPLYGFINLTPLEHEIIHSPFYQRLRWIRQLGFSSYTFPGAEHSRFGHSIGVMFNAHKIIERIGRNISDKDLATGNIKTPEGIWHQSIRIAALLHDLGTFPFSHTTEMAYIKYGHTTNAKNGKGHPDDHEHLGSFIIKNTNYEGGITHSLIKYGLDPQKISDLVKGIDTSHLANQILHSEVDCDRMDYLLRDAHYTGLGYGTYDRDYLLYHFTTSKIGGDEVLCINHNAVHCVEDFLMSRFAWYSQVVRSARGARFDAIAEEITFWLLERGKLMRYGQLLDIIANDPLKFYAFNDSYFMSTVHMTYTEGGFDSNPRLKDLAHRLLFDKPPRTIRCSEFSQKIMVQDDQAAKDKARKKAEDKIQQLQRYLDKHGESSDWILDDIPKKDIIFVRSKKLIVKNQKQPNILLERDPTKILDASGNVQLLADFEQSVIARLQDSFNFVPNVYCTENALELFTRANLLS